MLDTYEVLSELWIESLDVIKDSDMKARINGVASQMKGFDFFYGVSLGQLILRHSDNLSRTLQRADISVAEGQEVTRLTVTTTEIPEVRVHVQIVLGESHKNCSKP